MEMRNGSKIVKRILSPVEMSLGRKKWVRPGKRGKTRVSLSLSLFFILSKKCPRMECDPLEITEERKEKNDVQVKGVFV